MKILHTIASMASQSGGTTACTRELVQALNDLGCATDILTVEDRAGSPAEEESSFIRAVPNDLRTPLGISMNLRRRLGAWRDYDLYHTNGLWLDVNHATCAQARKTRKPCVASPHGMLYPQALAIKPWRKKLMLALGHRRDLAQADCLHATCREEARHLRELGFANPMAVIPNPVAVPSWIDQIRRREGERFRAGFLGRFHPIKNLESLIRAWGSLNLRDAELLLIGDGPEDYAAQLKRLAAEVGGPGIRFTGFAAGREKYELLASLNVLCAPSHQENFGMSIAEGLLAGTPVIASKGTPWEELDTRRCGWWRDNSPAALAAALEEAFNPPPPQSRAMGDRGRSLIMETYASPQVAASMKRLYRYLLGQEPKPEFVDLS